MLVSGNVRDRFRVWSKAITVGVCRGRRQRAVTLIEAVLFISIALGLIVGGIVFYQQAQTSQRTGEAARLVSSLVAELRAVAQSNKATNWLNFNDAATYLEAAGAIPQGAIYDGPDVQCAALMPWGDCVKMAIYEFGGDVVIQVQFTGIPTAICTRLLTFNANGSGLLGDGALHIQFGQNIGVQYPGYGRISVPTTPSALVEPCSAMGLVDQFSSSRFARVDFSL